MGYAFDELDRLKNKIEYYLLVHCYLGMSHTLILSSLCSLWKVIQNNVYVFTLTCEVCSPFPSMTMTSHEGGLLSIFRGKPHFSISLMLIIVISSVHVSGLFIHFDWGLVLFYFSFIQDDVYQISLAIFEEVSISLWILVVGMWR